MISGFNDAEEPRKQEFEASAIARRGAFAELIAASVDRENEHQKTLQAQRTIHRKAYRDRQEVREKDAEVFLKRVGDEMNYQEEIHLERFGVAQARRKEKAEAGFKGLQTYLEKRSEARVANSERYQAHELEVVQTCDANLEKHLQELLQDEETDTESCLEDSHEGDVNPQVKPSSVIISQIFTPTSALLGTGATCKS